MTNKVLSIIIPSYNTSRFVDECVPTFIDANLFDFVDVFFIDDGATDDTKEKLTPYLDAYPDYFHFYHKENGGHGSVINFAVFNLIKTKYFKVIDGDDYIDSKSMIDLVGYLKMCDDDLIVSGYCEKYPNSEIKIPPLLPDFVNLYKEKKTYGTEILPFLTVTIHSSTFKTKIFTANKICMPEKVFYEDNLYVLFPAPHLKKISFINRCIYFYRLGNPNQSVSLQGIIKHYDDAITIRKHAFAFYDKIKENIDTSADTFYINKIASSLSCYKSTLLKFNNNKTAREKCIELYENDKRYPNLLNAFKKYKFYRLLFLFSFRFIDIFRRKAMKN